MPPIPRIVGNDDLPGCGSDRLVRLASFKSVIQAMLLAVANSRNVSASKHVYWPNKIFSTRYCKSTRGTWRNGVKAALLVRWRLFPLY